MTTLQTRTGGIIEGRVWVIVCEHEGCDLTTDRDGPAWGFGDPGDSLALVTTGAKKAGWTFEDVIEKGKVVRQTVRCPGHKAASDSEGT